MVIKVTYRGFDHAQVMLQGNGETVEIEVPLGLADAIEAQSVSTCTIDDLAAIVPRWDRWSVNSEGGTEEMISDGHLDHGTEDIDEYVCMECGEYFTPEKHFDLVALDMAWQKAKAHLGAS